MDFIFDAVFNVAVNGRFYTRGHNVYLDELGQTFVIRLVIWLIVKTGTRRIIRLDELSSVVRLYP